MARDCLLKTLERLRDIGNTVIVVEHDEDAVRAADHVIDIGPRAGVHGGGELQLGPRGDLGDVVPKTARSRYCR